MNGTNLVEVLLYAHLLIEQALEILIRAPMLRPDVLADKDFARLTFAQKITVYVGLYDPDEETVWELRTLNRLRNRMAHSLVDLDHEVCRNVPGTAESSAVRRIQNIFLSLVTFGLGVIHGAVTPEDGPPAEGTHWLRRTEVGFEVVPYDDAAGTNA